MTTAASVARDSDIVGTLAGAPGFEPGITGPKPVALPLGYAPVNREAECTPPPGRTGLSIAQGSRGAIVESSSAVEQQDRQRSSSENDHADESEKTGKNDCDRHKHHDELRRGRDPGD